MYRLLLDIGNTSTKCMLASGNDWRIAPYSDGWQKAIQEYDVCEVICCASGEASEVLHLLQQRGINTTVVSATLPLPISIGYATPSTLGADRIATACGAWALYHQACVVADAGTCTTVDFISDQGRLEGGVIMPGIDMQLQSMHQHTARLPYIERYWEQQAVPLARTTHDALLSGAVCGTAFAIEGFARHYNDQSLDAKMILTGGEAQLLAPHLPAAMLNPDLLFVGLATIGQHLNKLKENTSVEH